MKWLLWVLMGIGLVTGPVDARQSSPALTLLWDQVHAQPADFSVACMPLHNSSGAVFYNAAEPFPLASVSKLLIFIEYARRVNAGVIALDEMVPLDRLNFYDIPRSNSGAHERFLAAYPPGIQSISLFDVAAVGMIQYSSNAATDYLLDRLAPVNWDNLYHILGITNTGQPHPLGIIALLMDNHDMEQWRELSFDEGKALFERYLSDSLWHQAEVTYRDRRARLPLAWDIESMILQRYTVTGTAQDFLTVLDAIYGTSRALSDNTKQMVRDALRWRDNDYIDGMYFEYGSKLGFYVGGTLTLVAYGWPHDSDPVISVAFFRNIPRPVYNDMRRQDSIGELAHWMNLNQCAGLLDAINSTE